MRCGYVVIPKELHGYDSEGNKVSISRLWSRRTSTKFNGASYIVQRGAAALFTMEGMPRLPRSSAITWGMLRFC